VSQGEYADGTDRHKDGQTPDRYTTLILKRGQLYKRAYSAPDKGNRLAVHGRRERREVKKGEETGGMKREGMSV